MCSYFLRAQVIVKTLTLRDGLSYIGNSIDFDLEAPFSAMKAIYFDAILNGFLTLGTCNFLDSFLKARDMKVMVAGSDHERAKSPTYIAFTILILILMPFDVILHDGKMLSIVTAFHVFGTVPNHKDKQYHSNYA